MKMKNILICLFTCMVSLTVFAVDYYIVEVNEDGTKEISSYGPVTNMPDIVEFETGFVRVSVTKAEYEIDAVVQEEDRLKNIPIAKITNAVNAANAEIATWTKEKKAIFDANKDKVKKLKKDK